MARTATTSERAPTSNSSPGGSGGGTALSSPPLSDSGIVYYSTISIPLVYTINSIQSPLLYTCIY